VSKEYFRIFNNYAGVFSAQLTYRVMCKERNIALFNYGPTKSISGLEDFPTSITCPDKIDKSSGQLIDLDILSAWNLPVRPPTSEEWPTVQRDGFDVVDVAMRSTVTPCVVRAFSSTDHSQCIDVKVTGERDRSDAAGVDQWRRRP